MSCSSLARQLPGVPHSTPLLPYPLPANPCWGILIPSPSRWLDLVPVVSRSITHLLVRSFTPSFTSCIQSVIHSSIHSYFHSFTHPCIYSCIDAFLMATLCADCVLLLLLQTQRLGSVISVCSMWAPDSPEGSGRVCTAHPRGIESCPQLWGAAQGPDSRPHFGMPLLPHFTQAMRGAADNASAAHQWMLNSSGHCAPTAVRSYMC